ncbi:MAG: hypothetical protein ACLFTB_09620 [Desulfovibrionales bacterium]
MKSPQGRISDTDTGISRKVAFLSAPQFHPHPTTRVEVVETHMAWVFLTDTEVYKLKKPVRYPFLDFSTLDAREAACRDEVQLNRRLAPDVYLGVAALVEHPSGSLTLDLSGRPSSTGEGNRIVEWLVRMRRLPEVRMLDAVISRGGPSPEELSGVAEHLSRFYAGLPPAPIDGQAYVQRFRREHALNMETLGRFHHAVDGLLVDDLAESVNRFLDHNAGLLADRVDQGMVKEGHGDLKPEHICLVSPPAIIDCLEFNLLLRCVDIVDDLTFLQLECRMLGADHVGRTIREQVLEGIGHNPSPELARFYMVYRACLRARLALAHLDEPTPREPEKWPVKAREYLEEARKDHTLLS